MTPAVPAKKREYASAAYATRIQRLITEVSKKIGHEFNVRPEAVAALSGFPMRRENPHVNYATATRIYNVFNLLRTGVSLKSERISRIAQLDEELGRYEIRELAKLFKLTQATVIVLWKFAAKVHKLSPIE